VRIDLAARARELAFMLTSWPSVTGTRDEASFGFRLTDYLTGQLVDGKGVDTVSIKPIPEDRLERCNVIAAKLGEGRQAVLLSGHYDTVPFEDYGQLSTIALDPLRLRDAMVARLQSTGENAKALADLQTGQFLPGRGLLDMKAGLAAGIAAMEAYEGAHNILFLATPDEENRSDGMRVGINQAQSFAAELDLNIKFCINLDAISDQGDGSLGKVAALGSIGKQLLTALTVGKEAHACYPQDGVNAAYLAAELAVEFELAQELSEVTGKETAAPPTALQVKDLKSGYNVTTPGQAWLYWNTLQHRRTAVDVLNVAIALAQRAMERVKIRTGRVVPVMTYANLAERVPESWRARSLQELASRHDLDLPERAKLHTIEAWSRSRLAGPAIVLGFGSVAYPAVQLRNEAFARAVTDAINPFGLDTIKYFPGISDMSFIGESEPGSQVAFANLPLWGEGRSLLETARIPCINIGPWGRDYHHWLERLHAPYAFEVLPQVLLAAMEAVFETD
jgi:arginine utilization protein RocB